MDTQVKGIPQQKESNLSVVFFVSFINFSSHKAKFKMVGSQLPLFLAVMKTGCMAGMSQFLKKGTE